jgi:hypothetical protein
VKSYSPIPAVDEAIRRFVREEDPPAPPHPGLDLARLEKDLGAIDPEVKVKPVVLPIYELSRAVFALKATRLVPGVHYAQLDVFIAGAAPLATIVWESKAHAHTPEPRFSSEAPGDRAAALEAAVRRTLAAAGLEIVPHAEAERVVRITDDPFYEGAYYEIRVFEMLFGMRYPERQR